MPFSRSLLALSMGLVLLHNPAFAAPPLSMTDGVAQVHTQDSNAWVEISKAAFEHNIRTLQTSLADKSKICAVLKADAYGHGIGLLMPSVIKLGVPCVGVASKEEARVVRESGFKGQLIRVRTAALSELVRIDASAKTIMRVLRKTLAAPPTIAARMEFTSLTRGEMKAPARLWTKVPSGRSQMRE